MRARTTAAAFLLLVAAMTQLWAQSEVPAEIKTQEQAKLLLRQAYDIGNQDRPDRHTLAIQILERVVAFDPELDVDFPKERTHLHAAADLGCEYFAVGDYEKALKALELAEIIYERKHPGVVTDLLWTGIVPCREKLAAAGKLDAAPLIIGIDRTLSQGPEMLDGVVFVPAGELAKLLAVDLSTDGRPGAVTFAARGRSITMTQGSRDALGESRKLRLPASPQKRGSDVLVPMRFVAEYLGASITWNARTRVASIVRPKGD